MNARHTNFLIFGNVYYDWFTNIDRVLVTFDISLCVINLK